MAQTWTGQLNKNILLGTLFNTIIKVFTNSKNVSNTFSQLLDTHREESGLFGDSIIRIETYPLDVHTWNNYEEAGNLLDVDPPIDPKAEKIVLDQFRQIRLTLNDNIYKMVFDGPASFSQFYSVCQQWMEDTKRIYDSQTFNAYVGTVETTTGKQSVTLTLPNPESETGGANQEAAMRLRTTQIAQNLADILIDIQDFGTEYNDYAIPRSYDPDDIQIVWNASWYNELLKAGLPEFFKDNSGLIDKFGQYVLPSRYFGKVNASGGTTGESNTTIRSLNEQDYTDASEVVHHVRAGDLLPANTTYLANETYTPDSTIVYKIIHKEDIPYVSGMDVSSSFWNARALLTNFYSTFLRNTLAHYSGLPLITVRATNEA